MATQSFSVHLSGYFMHKQFQHSKFPRRLPTEYTYVLCMDLRTVITPYAVVTIWFLQPRRSEFTEQYVLDLQIYFRLIFIFKTGEIW
jgi:hypothetical protein